MAKKIDIEHSFFRSDDLLEYLSILAHCQVHATKTNNLNVFSVLKLLHAEGGIKSFWRGNGINVVKIAPESAIKFMAYEQVRLPLSSTFF